MVEVRNDHQYETRGNDRKGNGDGMDNRNCNGGDLLIWCLPHEVARRTVAAHQNAIWMTSTIGCCATDLFRVLPYHLSVMTGRIPILRCQYAAVPILLFVDPQRLSFSWGRYPFGRVKACNVLTHISRLVGIVSKLA